MRLLFLGDVVGRTGRTAVLARLPGLISRYALDFVVVNGENAAGGFGITERIFEELIDAGADCVTTGNHVWDQAEALVFAERHDRFLRPLNYPKGTPGRGVALLPTRDGRRRVLVANLMGQAFISALDNPFPLIDAAVEGCPLGAACDAAIVDMHAEATSEKQAMGVFLDGRVSLVVGTHTHTPTADGRVLPGGTAYLSDAGMCGDYDSVLGMDKEEPVGRAARKIASGRFRPAEGPATLSGICVETDDRTGKALRIAHLRLGPHLEEAVPTFWEADAPSA